MLIYSFRSRMFWKFSCYITIVKIMLTHLFSILLKNDDTSYTDAINHNEFVIKAANVTAARRGNLIHKIRFLISGLANLAEIYFLINGVQHELLTSGNKKKGEQQNLQFNRNYDILSNFIIYFVPENKLWQ